MAALKSKVPSKVCFSIPYGYEVLQGCAHLLLTALQVFVMSVIEVRTRFKVPTDELLSIHRMATAVGAVCELLQFSLVPHFGDWLNT
jgi:hypothetical protein